MELLVGVLAIAAVIVIAFRLRSAEARRAQRRTVAQYLAGASNAEPPAPVRRQARPTTSQRKQEFPITWFGPDAELEVSGFRLKSPCVYASCGRDAGQLWATDPSEILVHAPVRRGQIVEMGYWPWYSRIDPANRHEYLSWLASGRASLPAIEGHLFLYFYGIERRLLVDQADRAWGLQEVVRLRRLDQPRAGTPAGRSFRQYSTGLLWFELARTPNQFDQRAFDLVVGLTERWTPELLAAPVAWLASRERPLPPALARELAAVDPTSQRSVVIKRVREEFDRLFESRYREQFGDGIALRTSKRAALHTYKPASGGLAEVRCEVVNPLGLASQFKPLPGIWNSCITDLRRLSRVSVAKPDGALTVDAWEAMPPELRADVDHPLADAVAAIVGAAADDDACAVLPAGRLAELIGIERRPSMTLSQSQRLAATIGHTGYCLVPDAMISPTRYGWEEPVAVLAGAGEDDVDPRRYNAAACVLRLGLHVALADGDANELELRVLSDHVDAVFGLSTAEQRRLAALRRLLIKTGADIRALAKVAEAMPADARAKVGRLLVAIAAGKGIDREERAALRRAFRALDLPPELLEQTIAQVAPDASDAEVQVRPASAGSGGEEAIPAPAQPGFRLDRAAISTIMAETREVSVLLATAMGVGADHPEEADAESTPVEAATESSTVATAVSTPPRANVQGPEGRYRTLFAVLVERERWTRAEADALARSQGLMLDAGVEAINDWAYEALGAPLVEERGGELVLDRSLLSEGEVEA